MLLSKSFLPYISIFFDIYGHVLVHRLQRVQQISLRLHNGHPGEHLEDLPQVPQQIVIIMFFILIFVDMRVRKIFKLIFIYLHGTFMAPWISKLRLCFRQPHARQTQAISYNEGYLGELEGVEGKGGGEAEEEERIHPVLSLLYFTPVYCKPYAVYSLLSSVYSSNILILRAAISIFTAL